MKDRATTIARSTDQPSEMKIHRKESIKVVYTQVVGRKQKEEVRPNSLKEVNKDRYQVPPSLLSLSRSAAAHISIRVAYMTWSWAISVSMASPPPLLMLE